MEFARAQFASDAPQLQLVAIADALTQASRPETRGAFDVAFLDSGSPSVNAAALVIELRRTLPSLPIVLALDPGRDDAARTAWQLGVDDYTVKSPGWLSRLTVRMSLAIARHERAARGEQLTAQADRLRSIVETAPACLARVARDGTILAVNEAARSMIGASTNREVLKKPLGAFVHADDRERAGRFIEQVSDGAAASLELSIARVSGESRPVDASAVPLPARGTVPATALLMFRERADSRRVEDPAARAAAAASSSRQAELERRVVELEAMQRRLEAERDAIAASANQAQADARAAQADARTLGERLQTAAETRQTLDAERAELLRELEARRAADEQHRRLAAEHQERLLDETRQRHADTTRLAADHAESQSRVSALDAECARLTLERNRLAADVEAARTAQQALDDLVARLRMDAAGSATAAAERDELRRSSVTLAAERDELQRSSITLAAERDELQRSSITLAAERDGLQRSSITLAAERDELRRSSATLAAERDDLRRAIETATARHATEVALVFADKASLERRLQETEASQQRQLDETRAAQGRALDDLTEERRRLEAEVELLTCERDAVLRALAESQQYEAAARHWITQWFELEQAMQKARSEIQQLVDWRRNPPDSVATPDAPPPPPSPSHATATDSPWH
jgi:PAS domain S-box-containing protein